uniref:Uncharacterized protein n=1 Tax=Romanomermis culicivorax TaxID=13658 RepID=A0A915IFN6_ROMCU
MKPDKSSHGLTSKMQRRLRVSNKKFDEVVGSGPARIMFTMNTAPARFFIHSYSSGEVLAGKRKELFGHPLLHCKDAVIYYHLLYLRLRNITWCETCSTSHWRPSQLDVRPSLTSNAMLNTKHRNLNLASTLTWRPTLYVGIPLCRTSQSGHSIEIPRTVSCVRPM